MKLRLASEGDLPAIARIQSASPEASQWEPASYLTYECWLAEAEGDLFGFLAIRQVAPGEHEILNLAVHPAGRRSGVARQLLQHVLTRRGTWFLEVRESNSPAVRLYEALGFQIVGERPDYYHDPAGVAIVMKFNS